MMTKRSFNKPAITHEEQVALLQKRGMAVDDVKAACFYLQHINYYRLRAYWLPFEVNPVTHEFKAGTNFATVLALYHFDRELRLLVIDALERIEISIRTRWTYHMAHEHGAHSHLDANLAKDGKWFSSNLESLEKEVKRANEEVFISHSQNTYKEPLPAIWVVSEVISLGLLSKLYTNLNPMPTRSAIAATYQLDERVLGSWLHHLTIIRNLCAHHSRLWNREFVKTPMRPKNKPSKLAGEFLQKSSKLYNTLVVLLYSMDMIAPEHQWRQELKNLLNNPNIPLEAMDFPADWKTRAIWQGEKA